LKILVQPVNLVFNRVYYYHLDAWGSTRLVTDASKPIKFVDNYKPFGEDNGTP